MIVMTMRMIIVIVATGMMMITIILTTVIMNVDHCKSLHTSGKAKLQGQIRRASKEHGFEKG